MKKKALIVLLSLCVAMTMTACGGDVDTTEVEETTVVEYYPAWEPSVSCLRATRKFLL